MKPIDIREEIANLEERIKKAQKDVEDNNTYHNRVLLQKFSDRRKALINGLRSSFKLIEGGIPDEKNNEEVT